MSQRAARQKKGVKKFVPRHTHWTIKEKKQLLQLLKSHSPNDVAAIQKNLKTKTKEEHWLWLIKDLTSDEEVDYTKALGRVLSIAANFEDFPPPSSAIPDYRAIHKYISALLLGEEIPELGPLESLVLLDQLHNLVDVLRTHDSTEQRKLMSWKYKMLASKVDMGNPHVSVNRALQALENDFSGFPEFLTPQSSSTALNPETAGTSGIDQSAERSGQRNDGSTDTDIQANQTETPPNGNQTVSYAQAENDNTMQSTDGQSTSEVQMLNGTQDPPVESSSTNAESSTINENSNSTDNLLKKGIVEDNQPEERRKRKRGRPKGKVGSATKKYFKKPALFTLNPFCIPINLLKMKCLIPEKVMEVDKTLPVNNHLKVVFSNDRNRNARGRDHDTVLNFFPVMNQSKVRKQSWCHPQGKVLPALTCMPYITKHGQHKGKKSKSDLEVKKSTKSKEGAVSRVNRNVKAEVMEPSSSDDSSSSFMEENLTEMLGEEDVQPSTSSSGEMAQKGVDVTEPCQKEEVLNDNEELTMVVTESHNENCTVEEQEKASAIMARITQEIMAKATSLL
ncbi:hypothetical protein FSP39_007792 [Pinctada imbricata]|uniref:Uncharacterized protein n=1 Tax=Pinctada imbricata TaxID=66713 RepID=A0AA88YTN6_PINIB|nr:hypothetical protein FSP39_007792 [Pinctada imbricata]